MSRFVDIKEVNNFNRCHNFSPNMTLGKGYIVLIAGVAMIVSGIAISALGTGSMLGSFLKENTVVAQTLIKPFESVNATLQVNDIARTVLHYPY